MDKKIRLLSFVVGNTTALLGLAAVLVVIGIFNETMNWDLFGPVLETILWGVFGSCMALAGIGVAASLVLGLKEIVKSFKVLEQQRNPSAEVDAPPSTYARLSLYVMLATAVLIVALATANYLVQTHRAGVYKRLAAEQMAAFEPKMAAALAQMPTPARDHVPRDIYDLVKTLDDFSFVRTATLYVPDPDDRSALWGFTAYRPYEKKDGFARFFIAKDFEKAMRDALDGNEAALDSLNKDRSFHFYHVIRNAEGRRIAVMRLDGNTSENFREYRLGS